MDYCNEVTVICFGPFAPLVAPIFARCGDACTRPLVHSDILLKILNDSFG